jgi:hypothetical protein
MGSTNTTAQNLFLSFFFFLGKGESIGNGRRPCRAARRSAGTPTSAGEPATEPASVKGGEQCVLWPRPEEATPPTCMPVLIDIQCYR